MVKHVLHGATLAVAGVGLLWGGMALAGPTDADKCYADKIKRAGWYSFCRMKAESKGVKKSEAPDFTKCDEKIVEKFGKAETKWGVECPTLGDVGNIEDQITTDTDVLVALLAGTTASECGSICGDAVVEGAEDCDVGTLNGESCVTQGFAGGTLACATGCTFDTSGCYAARFEDNGDGTVTDHQTGLMWEKKTDDSSIHDKDNFYDWDTAMGDWISEVNGWSGDGSTQSGLGGHTDWRMPTSAELQTILLEPYPCGTSPCIDPIFGPTQSDGYWSSTIFAGLPFTAFGVLFSDGAVGFDNKDNGHYVRAVRGGL